MSAPITNRCEFVYLFDVENGNPNGDPDAGNLPRVDPETNHGIVTDVCLKRKIRNYVDIVKADPNGDPAAGYDIYVRDRGVLNRQHEKAYSHFGLKSEPKKLPKDPDKARELTRFMCSHFFDIRTFGAVMTTEVNCGQVRGPVQIAFARSIEPVLPVEAAITRMAVTNEKDLEKERTIGRKAFLPYALFRAEGFVSAPLARQTGFSEDDLSLLWEALGAMFDHDRSAARGKMSARGLIVFRHETALGNAPAHRVLETVRVERAGDPSTPARHFSDYAVTLDAAPLPAGVTRDVKF